MAGHSKWANIKRRKGAQDAKKARIFTKLLKEIVVATQQGGDKPEDNPKLRLAIQNAKSVNIPKDNILRAIQKGSGANSQAYIHRQYEGYGPQGIAILVETMSDNTKRTVADVRALFNKYGGSLSKQGALTHLFDHLGTFLIPKNNIENLDELSLQLIEEGLDNVEELDQHLLFIATFKDFAKLQVALEQHNIAVEEAKLTFIPHTLIKLQPDAGQGVYKLLDALEELDDVQAVYHNLQENQ